MNDTDQQNQDVELSFDQIAAFHRGDSTALAGVQGGVPSETKSEADEAEQQEHDDEQQRLLDAQKATGDKAKTATEKPAAKGATKEPAIPLSRHKAILKAAQQRADDATTRATEAANKLAEMQAKGKSNFDIDEALAKIKEDYPAEVADVLTALRDQNAALAQRLEAKESANAAATQETALTRVITAIESIPDLKGWRDAALAEGATDEQKLNWETALAHDADLQAARAWKGKPLAERFAEATRLTQEELGLTPTAAPRKNKDLPQQQTKAPSSLSNLPAGAPPSATGQEAWANADPFALMAQTQNMKQGDYSKFVAQKFGVS